MKKILFSLSLLLLSASVFAWTIGPMNYQGRLLDNAGIPVTGSYNFKVRIYDALSGGTLKFSEDQNSIAVADGVYSFLVSTGTNPTGTWDINLWNTPSLYLEIEVNGQTLTPRHLLASTPFAFQANLALTTNNALALGGKSLGSVLQDICTSTKGKWLDLAQKCLGVGALFPGPVLVSWSALSTSNDFSNLDLSKANISGINFTGANLSNSIFKETTYAVQGLGDANLTGTTWDAAVATDTVAYPVTGEWGYATFKNMQMNRWNLASMGYLDGVSAAFLGKGLGASLACPAALPAQYVCRIQKASDPLYQRAYFILGPYVNLSKDSALSVITNGVSILPIDENLALSSCGDSSCSLLGVNFRGQTITQNFTGSNLQNTHFDYATIIRSADPAATQWNFPAIDSAYFTHSKIVNITFGGLVTGTSFDAAELDYVHFNAGSTFNFFPAAVLKHVTFSNATNNDFRRSVLDTVTATTSGGGNQMPTEIYSVTGLP